MGTLRRLLLVIALVFVPVAVAVAAPTPNGLYKGHFVDDPQGNVTIQMQGTTRADINADSYLVRCNGQRSRTDSFSVNTSVDSEGRFDASFNGIRVKGRIRAHRARGTIAEYPCDVPHPDFRARLRTP